MPKFSNLRMGEGGGGVLTVVHFADCTLLSRYFIKLSIEKDNFSCKRVLHFEREIIVFKCFFPLWSKSLLQFVIKTAITWRRNSKCKRYFLKCKSLY